MPDHKLMQRIRQWGIAVGTGGLLVLAAWGWARGGDGAATGSVPPSLRIGFADEAPYAFLDEDGRVTGEAPEVARAVAQRLGRGEPEWVLAEFGSLIEQLNSGRFDVVAAGLFITPEREEQVAFSRPTMLAPPGLLVARGNPLGLYSHAAAVARPEVRLAAIAGSVEERLLSSLGLPTDRLALVPDPQAGVALVQGRRVDGLALSQPTVRWWARQKPHSGTVESAEPLAQSAGIEPARVAFAFRREDKALREAWDAALADYMASGAHEVLLRELGIGEIEIDGREVARP